MGSDGHQSHTLCKANNWALALWLVDVQKKTWKFVWKPNENETRKEKQIFARNLKNKKKNKQTKYLVADGQTPITPKYFECGCFRLVILRRFVNGQEIALTIFFPSLSVCASSAIVSHAFVFGQNHWPSCLLCCCDLI